MSKPTEPSRIPQPRPRPIVGNVPDIDPETPVQSMMALAKEHGPIYRLTFPGDSFVLVGSRELAAEFCDEARFEKHLSGPIRHIRDLAGDGLFTAENDEPNWGKAHRILMPAFGPGAMRSYFDDMLDVADQMLTKWERFGADATIDVTDDMTRLTLDTIALCGFGYRFNSFYQREMHPFVDAMVRSLAEAGHRSRRMPLQTQLMFRTQRQFDADASYMYGVTDELIAQRRKVPTERAPRDLLGLMLNARDPVTDERLDDANIRFQLVTFLVAGHETTSGLLSFAVHLLLENPAAMARARAEVDAVLGTAMPRFEDIAKLGYIDQVLRETLRLYPTAPAFAVHAKHDTVVAGRYEFKRGDIAMVVIPTVHRDPAVWTDPERFDPDRFEPAARQRIPDKAWIPFGNGPRACIGRAFALQEATLVLALLLQRFEITRSAPYTLKIKETLTLKPSGLGIRARVRGPVSRAFATRPPANEAAAAPTATAAAHGTPLLLLYGSNSGASEAFARRIASDGQARGWAARVLPLDGATGRLPREGAVVIVTASYNGRPPDNARAFCAWLDGVPAASLSGVRYAVFGCGNRDWTETYQAVPSRIDAALREAGAQALLDRGEADARGDFFGDFERWYAPLWGTVGAALSVVASETATGPLYRVEVAPSSDMELVRQNRLDLATVVENRELVDLSSPLGRSKRHLEFTLPAGTSYAAGDYLAVLPENHPELVERAARRFGMRPDAALVLRSTRGAMSASLPTDRPVSAHELLSRYVELSAPATQRDVARLAERNACPPHRAHLATLAADPARYATEVLDPRVSVLDLLEEYPSCELSFGEFLELLPAMRVRQYSISSSPRWNAAHCTLTVAVVDGPARSGRGRYRGICSSYLAGLRVGDQAAVAIRSPNVPFHPPASSATPVVMICAGTGLAPFRGFLQERAARRAAGEATGEALLFFGCDHPDVDFLYRDEIAAWERDGVVTVLPAFFRQPDGDVTFVQHRLWQERARFRDVFARGATVYLCGDGERMAPAVRETLVRMHREETGCTDDEAAAWLRTLEREGRYVPDVFG